MNAAVAERGRGVETRRLRPERVARDLLSKSGHFLGRIECFDFIQQGDVLIVEGAVPSFYLKQVLQCVLKNLDDVRRIDNRVKVICSNGMSSHSNPALSPGG